jgi:carboxyl-terminal processing protease
MPDFFVPLDTTMSSSYINRLFNSDSSREFILDYLEKNKKKFDGMSFEDYYSKYQISEEMLQSLVKVGERNKVKFDEKDFKKSKEYLKILLKAHMGRNIYDDNAFYKIINVAVNEAYQQALNLFDEAENLALAPRVND